MSLGVRNKGDNAGELFNVPSNHERISRALDLMTSGLAPFVEAELKETFGERWQQAAGVSFRDRRGEDEATPIQWDAHSLLTVMWDNWNGVFQKKLSRSDRSLVSELRDFRNRWAHQHEFDFDDSYRALDSVHRLLRSVGARQADAVAREKRYIMREEIRAELRAQSGGFAWSENLGWIAVYLLCCAAVIFHVTYFWGTSTWFLSVLIVAMFGYLIYQRISIPSQEFGPHECAACGKIIYSESCPYCANAAAT